MDDATHTTTPNNLTRSDLGVIMLAAWLNVTPEQVPAEYKTQHANKFTMAAWQRVGQAALDYHRQAMCAERDALREALEDSQAILTKILPNWSEETKDQIKKNEITLAGANNSSAKGTPE